MQRGGNFAVKLRFFLNFAVPVWKMGKFEVFFSKNPFSLLNFLPHPPPSGAKEGFVRLIFLGDPLQKFSETGIWTEFRLVVLIDVCNQKQNLLIEIKTSIRGFG